jgi:hypothetical protein
MYVWRSIGYKKDRTEYFVVKSGSNLYDQNAPLKRCMRETNFFAYNTLVPTHGNLHLQNLARMQRQFGIKSQALHYHDNKIWNEIISIQAM